MGVKTSRMESVFEEGDSFVDFLPYLEFHEGVFIQVDGSLGKIWELSFIEAESQNSFVLKNLVSNINGIINRLTSDKLSCQMILLSDSAIEDKLSEYTDYTEEGIENEIVKSCMEERVKHICRSKEGFFEHRQGTFSPRRLRLFFTLRYFPDYINPSLTEQIKYFLTESHTFSKALENNFAKYKKTVDKYGNIIDSVFKANGMECTAIQSQEMILLLYRILNPRRAKKIPYVKENKEEAIRDQVLYNAPSVTDHGMTLEGYQSRVVTLKELPEETYMGMFTSEEVKGSRFCMLDLVRNFMMVINFMVPSQETALKRLKLQKGLAFVHRKDIIGDDAIEAQEQKKELDKTISETFRGGKRVVYPRVHFIVMEESEDEIERAADDILSILNRLGCEGLKEDIIGGTLFLSCLPLNFNPKYEQIIKRTKRMLSTNFLDMLPMYGAFQGTRTPAQIYFNRRGEILNLDLFDANKNPHGLIIGASGAGKSFWINDFILQNYRLGSHFFVLDKGESYKKLCSILGGQYIKFSFTKPLTINPFYREPTSENIAFLREMLAQMASGCDERDRLNREQKALLLNAVHKAYKQKEERGEEVFLLDVVIILKSDEFNEEKGLGRGVGQRLAYKLTDFTRMGPYGKFFDGPNQFNLDSQFTVFELANLSDHSDLQMVVLLNIMFFITNFISSETMKPKRKFLLIDEAWSLLDVEKTADFIRQAFKTYRKYRCSVVAITQDIEDLTESASGKAIITSSANKIILSQEPVAIERSKKGLSLSEDHLHSLKSLEIIKGKFSEAMFLSEGKSGIIRLVPDPFLYWVANTEPRNNRYLNNKIKECDGQLLEALNQCVKEYPYGIK